MSNINISGIKYDSVVDGEGLRTVVFVSGCWMKCEDCHNKDTWDKNYGESVDIKKLGDKIISYPIGNITISGGDPLSYQRKETYELIKYIKDNSNKTIWVYTGMLFEDLLNSKDIYIKALLYNIDVLVDGVYDKNLKDINCLFRGSKNQRLIDVKESLINYKIVEIECK